jgi:hypothetical protein
MWDKKRGRTVTSREERPRGEPPHVPVFVSRNTSQPGHMMCEIWGVGWTWSSQDKILLRGNGGESWDAQQKQTFQKNSGLCIEGKPVIE